MLAADLRLATRRLLIVFAVMCFASVLRAHPASSTCTLGFVNRVEANAPPYKKYTRIYSLSQVHGVSTDNMAH